MFTTENTEDTEKKKSGTSRRRWRTLAKIAVVVLVLAALIPTLQILVPAIAYRDELLALLKETEGCESPCFMGIRFGVTTYEEAVEILNQRGWASAGYDYIVAPDSEILNNCYCNWVWSGKQPGIIDTTQYYGFYVGDGVVYSITVPLHINFAGLLLNLGYPDASGPLYVYDRYTVSVRTGFCERNLYDLFAEITTLDFKRPQPDEALHPYILAPQYIANGCD